MILFWFIIKICISEANKCLPMIKAFTGANKILNEKIYKICLKVTTRNYITLNEKVWSVTLSEWNMHTTHYTKVNCLHKFCKLYTHVSVGINTWKSPFPVIVREHFLSLCFHFYLCVQIKNRPKCFYLWVIFVFRILLLVLLLKFVSCN